TAEATGCCALDCADKQQYTPITNANEKAIRVIRMDRLYARLPIEKYLRMVVFVRRLMCADQNQCEGAWPPLDFFSLSSCSSRKPRQRLYCSAFARSGSSKPCSQKRNQSTDPPWD